LNLNLIVLIVFTNFWSPNRKIVDPFVCHGLENSLQPQAEVDIDTRCEPTSWCELISRP